MAQKRFIQLLISIIVFSWVPPTQAIQFSDWNESFAHQTFLKTSQQIDNSKNECAKFVNRLFLNRFNKPIWGDAWNIPLQKENQKYLKLQWVVNQDQINQQHWVHSTQDRIEMFKELYKHAQKSPSGFGLAGFSYRYSFAYPYIPATNLPQTHIAFISPQKLFAIKNASETTKTVQELLEEKVGTIHPVETHFVNQQLNKAKNLAEKRIFLHTPIAPKQSFFFYDFPLEEQFRYPRQENILFSFLRKHRNNKVSALLRPVSWTDILPSVWK
ncbi:hypothetical protein CSB37_01570 [bacterium DOLZORAL124_38_8]|nr:MAG: hypothetical protein CSB37_01570 [bacterium DOLZORAL124_38_8]